MRRREFFRSAAALSCAAAVVGRQPAFAVPVQELAGMALPRPESRGGKPLMEALRDRKTIRETGAAPLSPQMISNLLWAAWGVNRPATNGRTAPSAFNVQEIDLYVFLAAGVYLFDGRRHSLQPVIAGDHRALTGSQPGVATAPVSLVYVADLAKYGAPNGDHVVPSPAERMAWSNAHC